jgi:peptidoglycan hydrolase-like protein with peptidoglycan-binding domain
LIRDSVLAHWGSSAASAGPSPATTSTSRSAIAGRNDLPTWGYGTVGEPVKELQRLLIATGASELADHGLTGRFYAVTQRAVRQFQQLVRDRHDASMVVDGVVGPTTWAWLLDLAGEG